MLDEQRLSALSKWFIKEAFDLKAKHIPAIAAVTAAGLTGVGKAKQFKSGFNPNVQQLRQSERE